jgi:hypothetical protein
MLDALAASDLYYANYHVVQAAVRWADPETGIVRPSVETWAKYARMDERTLQRALRDLSEKQVVKPRCDMRGGAGKVVVYEIPMLAVRKGGVAPPIMQAETVAPDAPNGGVESAKGGVECAKGWRGTIRRTDTENKEEHTQESEAVRVLRSLGLGDELLRHRNATPERLEYVAREAQKATTKNPVGLATQAIREAWNPPTVAPGGAGGVNKAERAKATVAGLSDERHAELLARVRREYPNLANCANDSSPVVGAMAKLANGAAAAQRRDDAPNV